MQLTEIALRCLKKGLAVIPVDDEKRPAVPNWKQFQERLPTEQEARHMLAGDHWGLAAICGPASGNLEAIDLDFKHDREGNLISRFEEAVEKRCPGLLKSLLSRKHALEGGIISTDAQRSRETKN